VQSLFLSIQVPEVPQINITVFNLQIAVLSLGSWIEQLNLQLWVRPCDSTRFLIVLLELLLFNFVDLIWIIASSELGTSGLGETLAAAHDITIASGGPVPIVNLTGVQIWLKVVEAPWLGILTNTICFGLALANATWSLSQVCRSSCTRP
jgi:hypothetical protein